MVNHAPRITRSYSDLSGLLSYWYDKSTHVLVCQHDPDEKVRQTHLHLGIWGCDVQAEALKRKLNDGLECKLSGNKSWSWVHEEYPEGLPDWEDIPVINGQAMPGNKNQQSNYFYLRYCIKGDLNHVKFSKNIPTALLEAAAADWAAPVKGRSQPEASEESLRPRRERPPPYQQLVIADAAERWYAYKREAKSKDELANETEVVEFVCDAMRKHSKGVNPHMVRDLSYAVLYDDLEYKSVILAKCRKFF